MKYQECVHYAGGNGGVCRAGVTIAAMRDQDLRLPCVIVNDQTGTISCDELVLPKALAASLTGMTAALEHLQAGRCPTCHDPITAEHDLGRVVKAQPCDHTIADRRRR